DQGHPGWRLRSPSPPIPLCASAPLREILQTILSLWRRLGGLRLAGGARLVGGAGDEPVAQRLARGVGALDAPARLVHHQRGDRDLRRVRRREADEPAVVAVGV